MHNDNVIFVASMCHRRTTTKKIVTFLKNKVSKEKKENMHYIDIRAFSDLTAKKKEKK